MSDLIRIRYNTKVEETVGGQWKWRVILEGPDGFEEVLVKSLILNVPSFSRETICPWLAANITSHVSAGFESTTASALSIRRIRTVKKSN
jgi:hypothetical protein